jgi:hypothetical protein
MNINKDYPCNSTNYTKVSSRKIEYIVVHYTGGVGTAKNNVQWYRDDPKAGASAHFFVGHKSEGAQIYQSVDPKDKAWHCGAKKYYHPSCRNTNSIGIETCCHNDTSDKSAESSDWYFDHETEDRLVELVKSLMEEYGIGVDHVVRHYDVTHKTCPAMWVHDESAWLTFKARLTEKGAAMNIVKGSTVSETKMIKGIQSAIGAVVDGQIGTQTLSDIACKLNADCFPLTLSIYGAPVIICNDLSVIASPGKGVEAYANSINGSFTMPQKVGGMVPISICVSNGAVKCPTACHSNAGYPESVLFRRKNGFFGIARVKNVSELPPDLRWAVGGMGLLDKYDPAAEGFKKIGNQDFYSTVAYDTGHALLGVKNNRIYLIYCASMTGPEVNAFAKKLGLEKAVMLDGGHLAAINGADTFSRVNTGVTQGYVLQGI